MQEFVDIYGTGKSKEMQEGQPFREVKDMAEELVRMGFARYEKEVKEKVEVSHQEKAEGEPIKRKKTK